MISAEASDANAAGPVQLRLDAQGRIESWNAALARLWGRAEAQALGQPLAQLAVAIDPRVLPDFGSASEAGPWQGTIALLPSGEAPPRLAGLRGVRLGASTWELSLSPAPERAAAALETGVPGNAQHHDTQRLAAVLEHMPGFCYTVDRELVFTSSAGAGLAHLNLRPRQVVGMSLFDLWGTRQPSYEPLLCHLRALAGIPGSYQDFCLGRSLEYQIQPLRGPDGSVVGVIGVGFDVTDREQARQQEAQLTAQLRQAQKMEAIGRLAGGVAHDFNNYLTCIMGNLSLLEGRVNQEVATCLVEANAAVDNAASLTRQLLAFSRKQVISPRPISLSSLVERLSRILERLVGARIQLRTRCAEELWNVNADPGQLEQVLVNLVMNARDAISDQGEVLIETRNLQLGTGSEPAPEPLVPGDYVCLSVRDSGRGLSDVVRARLFEPFFTTKDQGAGTGLGLATVYGAVRQNGGAITVESELGKGTTFSILLPRVEAPCAKDVPLPSTSMSAPSGGTETILLVEDEPSVLELAHCTLQQLGYHVLPCASADEALRTFGQHQGPIDLLVTDVVMPRMNGRELSARINALRPGISVLFSSGYGENIIAKQGVIDDGLHFIGKPYRPRELAAKVRVLLDQRSARP
ncbi:MAG TPA: ATP-binding protein [Polyangiaceae bacterium]|nr:ATP-binding protein [Polyangiaceae bacterium]